MAHTSILRAEQVSTICPTKVPMRGGATFINEGLASFEGSIGDRADLKGSGIAECAYSIFLSRLLSMPDGQETEWLARCCRGRYWTNVLLDAASPKL